MLKCPKDKLINPHTGNCVKKDGRVGKLLLAGKKSSKKCPRDKIINPDTGNCVKKDGKVGKLIISSAKKSVKKSVKKPTAKGCVRQTTAKYHAATRKSPPYPANQCQGKSLYGNDGNMYVSVSNVNGIYTWRLKK